MTDLQTGQFRLENYYSSLRKYGQRYLVDAYKRPSAAKKAAWMEIEKDWQYKADPKSMTIVHDGCQQFSVGLIMHKDIFVYITKSRYNVYKIDPIEQKVLYEIPYDKLYC